MPPPTDPSDPHDLAPRNATLVYKEGRESHLCMSQNAAPSNSNSRRRQGIFWLLTIPYADFTPPTSLPESLSWIKGQHERGESGYEHWQLLVALSRKGSLSTLKTLFGNSCHAELSRSEAAEQYVWKDATAVAGTRFEFGTKPIRRNSKTDWESVWTAAKSGDLESIPAHVRVTSYRTLQCIRADHESVPAMVRSCNVFWGKTGTGKSRRAWEEAGVEAYSKDPRTKFWCGYQGQANVVIDEFRGGIDIAHFLRWIDRYAVRVEIKGGSRPLMAKTYWITSNLSPDDWFPDIDEETRAALRRRLTVTHFDQL